MDGPQLASRLNGLPFASPKGRVAWLNANRIMQRVELRIGQISKINGFDWHDVDGVAFLTREQAAWLAEQLKVAVAFIDAPVEGTDEEIAEARAEIAREDEERYGEG